MHSQNIGTKSKSRPLKRHHVPIQPTFHRRHIPKMHGPIQDPLLFHNLILTILSLFHMSPMLEPILELFKL